MKRKNLLAQKVTWKIGASLFFGLPLIFIILIVAGIVLDQGKTDENVQLLNTTANSQISAPISVDLVDDDDSAGTAFGGSTDPASVMQEFYEWMFNPILDALEKQGNLPYQTYTVQPGESLYSIAEKFGVSVNSIYWNNHLSSGKVDVNTTLVIPPTDGIYYILSPGETLSSVAKKYRLEPQKIINWNTFLTSTTQDERTVVFLPGAKNINIGEGESFQTLNTSNGKCPISESKTGTGILLWPTTSRLISGYKYEPENGHPGLDIGVSVGQPIYAVDAGVVVWAEYSNVGYGNLVIIDHFNGWSSLYAHLDDYAVKCGDAVDQGQIIGFGGNTGNSSGPHLHLEIKNKRVPQNPQEVIMLYPEDFMQ